MALLMIYLMEPAYLIVIFGKRDFFSMF